MIVTVTVAWAVVAIMVGVVVTGCALDVTVIILDPIVTVSWAIITVTVVVAGAVNVSVTVPPTV